MFDDIIKDKANSHEAPVPPDAWDNIVNKKRERRFAWWWFMGVLLLGITAAVIFLPENTIDPGASATARSKQEGPVTASDTKNKVNSTVQQPVNSKTEKAIAEEAVASTVQQQVFNDHDRGETSKQSTNSQNGDGTITSKLNKKKKFSGHLNSKTKAVSIFPGIEETGEEKNNEEDNTIAAVKSENDKNTVAPVTGENKELADITKDSIKSIAAVNKNDTVSDAVKKEYKDGPAKKVAQGLQKSWFADIGIAPMLPIQQNQQPASLSRTTNMNNIVSVFSARSVRATVDASVAFSLAVRKQLNKRIFIGAGLQFLQLKENIMIIGDETRTTTAIVDRLVSGQSGPVLVQDTVTAITEGTREINAVNSYRLFSIPLFIQYNIVQRKSWSLAATGGVYINILGTYENSINKNAAALLVPVGQPAYKSSTGIDLYTGLRIGKTVGKRWELFALPSIRFNPGRYTIKNSLISRNIHQAGMSLGLSFRIN
ncbi:MAG: hypothetical protein QM791_21140 [Ferruginibacter sp.]